MGAKGAKRGGRTSTDHSNACLSERGGVRMGFSLACYSTLGKSSLESVVFGYMEVLRGLRCVGGSVLLVCFFFWILGVCPFFFFFRIQLRRFLRFGCRTPLLFPLP
jgi:ABC-type amino acid transport system permease subunit